MIQNSLTFNSTFGRIRLIATDTGLCRVVFLPNQSEKNEDSETKFLRSAQRQLLEYLSSQRKVFDINLDMAFSSAFMQDVFSIVRQIPFGETKSYSEIAKILGKPSASRAVGAALAANPILIIIPCHRVIAADGRLTGYAGGLDKKVKLLELEGHKIVGEKLA